MAVRAEWGSMCKGPEASEKSEGPERPGRVKSDK